MDNVPGFPPKTPLATKPFDPLDKHMDKDPGAKQIEVVVAPPKPGQAHYAKEPPRPPTRIVPTPTPVLRPEPEKSAEQLEEELRQEEGPPPPRPPPPERPPPPPRRGGHYQHGQPEPIYEMQSFKVNPAHGACDPAAIFEVRAALEQVKADVPAYVCLDTYKAVDNALLDLRDGFDRGVAKCGNQAWVGMVYQKADAFHRCIVDEIRQAPHITPETRDDIDHKWRVSVRTLPRRLLWPEENVAPGRWGRRRQPGGVREEEVARKIRKGPEEDSIADTIADSLPPEAHVKSQRPRGAPPVEVIKRSPNDGDIPNGPWTEPGAPPSLVNSQAPALTVAALCPAVRPCAVSARRKRAEGFLCGVRD